MPLCREHTGFTVSCFLMNLSYLPCWAELFQSMEKAFDWPQNPWGPVPGSVAIYLRPRSRHFTPPPQPQFPQLYHGVVTPAVPSPWLLKALA